MHRIRQYIALAAVSGSQWKGRDWVIGSSIQLAGATHLMLVNVISGLCLEDGPSVANQNGVVNTSRCESWSRKPLDWEHEAKGLHAERVAIDLLGIAPPRPDALVHAVEQRRMTRRGPLIEEPD